MEGYTVVKGDCLSKIAGMKNIYGNSKLWPAIWEANKSGSCKRSAESFKNNPESKSYLSGQKVLKIPALTDAQKTEMMNKANSYKGMKKKRVMKNRNH